MRTTNIRFREKREEDDRAWDILHKLEELNCKSQSALVVKALNAYYDRHLKKQADPYFETREKEDAFAERIVEAVEKKVFSMLPTMVGMAFMQQMEGLSGTDKVVREDSGQMGAFIHGMMTEDGINVPDNDQMMEVSGNLSDMKQSVSKEISSDDGVWEWQQKSSESQKIRTEILTEDDVVEENEYLDTDLF